jgi:hypothetical protein
MEPEQIRLKQIAVGSSPSLENAKSNLDTLNLVWGISIGNPFTGNCHSLITILHATPVINSSGFLGIWWPRSTPVGSSPASVRVHTSQFSLSSATMIAHTETSSLRQHPPLWNYFLAPLRMYNKLNGFFAFRQFTRIVMTKDDQAGLPREPTMYVFGANSPSCPILRILTGLLICRQKAALLRARITHLKIFDRCHDIFEEPNKVKTQIQPPPFIVGHRQNVLPRYDPKKDKNECPSSSKPFQVH